MFSLHNINSITRPSVETSGRHLVYDSPHQRGGADIMASIYSQLAQDLWSNSKPKSNVESLMQTYEEPKDRNGARSRSPTCGRAISRMAHEEELHEREMLNIRNFGYHWLKPIGMTKTMGQIADEAREIHDSYEEYEDEEGEFNQNDPNLTGLEMEGETAQADDELEGEEADLDQDVEEGASFDVGDTSFVSSVPDGSSDADTSAHYATLDGQPVSFAKYFCHDYTNSRSTFKDQIAL